MRQCKRCHDIKDDSDFSPKQSQCKACRAEAARFDRIVARGERAPIPRHIAPTVKLIQALLKAYDSSEALPIPVRAIGNAVTAPDACILRPDGPVSFYHIASTRGARTLQYETTGPFDLIRNLLDLGLEVIPDAKV